MGDARRGPALSVTLDVNVLLHAVDLRAAENARARELLESLASRTELVVFFWPVLMSFVRISSNRSWRSDPLTASQAQENVRALLAWPHSRAEGEGSRFWRAYEEVAGTDTRGNDVPDAHIVALMREHGVRTIYTRDRDFRRYAGIEVLDPFA